MLERLQRLRGELDALGVEGVLVTDMLNVRYLSGFTGSYAVLLVTSEAAFLLTDSRYAEQAVEEGLGFTLELVQDGWLPAAQKLVDRMNLRRTGFEAKALCYEDWLKLQDALPFTELVALDDPIGSFRMIKDESEIRAIRDAVRIVDLAYEHITGFLVSGVSELDIAVELDCFMRKSGAEKEAFDSIVASGPRSALPHAKPTNRTISEGELIVLDFGARYGGYHSDITRTVLLGTADARQEEVYEVVLEGQSRAIDAIRPGLTGGEIDAVAREHIAGYGYGEYFGHGLGHGLGLSVHDGRILSKGSQITLRAGMIVTVEPGIYIPGWGGVRIEDDVLVTESGHQVLTSAPRILRIK